MTYTARLQQLVTAMANLSKEIKTLRREVTGEYETMCKPEHYTGLDDTYTSKDYVDDTTEGRLEGIASLLASTEETLGDLQSDLMACQADDQWLDDSEAVYTIRESIELGIVTELEDAE